MIHRIMARSGETLMNRGSHLNHENIKPWHDGFPPQGLSEVRRGSAVFTTMLTGTDPLRGRPVRGSGVHRK